MDRPNPFKDPRVLVAAGTVVAAFLAIAVLAAMLLIRSKPAAQPASADRGGLQVEMGKGDEKLDPARPLRCFVGGKFVGQAMLADCAARNGVSAQNLDVGLDPSGQIAAQAGAPAPLAPLPQPTSTGVAANLPADTARQTPSVVLDGGGAGEGGACLRYAAGGWRAAGEGGGLKACVHALYDDRCVRPGEALYGRFGQQTLRLVPGRVEISADNRSFRPLVAQDPDACALAE